MTKCYVCGSLIEPDPLVEIFGKGNKIFCSENCKRIFEKEGE